MILTIEINPPNGSWEKATEIIKKISELNLEVKEIRIVVKDVNQV